MANKNYYEILGVSKTATQDEIKSAYRKLVKQYHPDLHPNDETCAAKFKEINEANEVLSDPQKRQQYDYELENPYASAGGFGGASGGDPFSGFGDIFSNIFSGFGGGDDRASRKGKDITYEINLSFLDAALGCTKEFSYNRKDKCPDCNGTGAKGGTAFKTCEKCNGIGTVKVSSGSGFFRTITTRVCDACGGVGKIILEKCPTCNGKGTCKKNQTVKFDIPAGADNGSYIRRKGYGETPDYGGEPGDLIVMFTVKEHRIFKRKDFDLYVTVPIDFKTACMGGKVLIPALDKPFEYNVPDGIQSGKVIVMRGKGIKGRTRTGDMYVTFQVETPAKLTLEQKTALGVLCDGFTSRTNPAMNTFKENMGKEYGVDPYIKS
ncbi:MAG: J domain-containing protein [Christensenellaceae bacterium]|nr:J domain-containing protein [Christensenellaceae bacterium]MDD6926859.1 J domain-containing protein [bacterium]MDY2851768.1 J domain-containing protein [Christensenellaceae bacterium]